jgi:dTDP-4-dehydrorhamnose reductase
MRKIIITGISGFLGQHFVDASSDWEIHGIYYRHPFKQGSENFWEIDLTDINYTKIFFDQIQPKAIVHLAAISSPTDCEVNSDYAYQLNVVIPSLLAQYAFSKNIPFYFISTDLVFDGQEGGYHFQDHPAPINRYGKQKHEAERRILDTYPMATIIRLPLLYGYTPHKRNFLIEWVEKLQHGEEIVAFSDEYRSPIYVKDAAEGILHILEGRHQGIWHLGGPDRLSRYEMAIKIADAIEADQNLIIAKRLEEVNLSISRPADVSLICQKTDILRFTPRNFEQGLEATLNDLRIQPRNATKSA